jgi:hypothetical protein
MSKNTKEVKFMKVKIDEKWQTILSTAKGVLGTNQEVIIADAIKQYLSNHPDMAPFVKLALKKKGQ